MRYERQEMVIAVRVEGFVHGGVVHSCDATERALDLAWFDADAAHFDLSIHAASNYSTAGAFHIEVDGKDVTGKVSVDKTGGWDTYKWFGKTDTCRVPTPELQSRFL